MRRVFSKYKHANGDTVLFTTFYFMHTIQETHRWAVTQISYGAYFFIWTRNPKLTSLVHWTSLSISYKISDSSFPMDKGLDQLCIFQIRHLSSEFWIIWEKYAIAREVPSLISWLELIIPYVFLALLNFSGKVKIIFITVKYDTTALLPLNPFESSFKIILNFKFYNIFIWKNRS